jgi:murein DD-endopeptidase MepM/ murein hydrolase activator NlpD
MTARRPRRSFIGAAAALVLAAGLFAVEKVAFDHRSAAGETTLAAPQLAAAIPDPAPPPSTLVDDADIIELRRRRLLIPVEGVSAVMLVSTFHQPRNQGEHEALDILAPLGTRALAVEDGTVEKLFTSQRGGLTIYLFDPTGVYCYYYAHLDHYADIREGQHVNRRQVIGYVGTTGNAPPNTPHLHFAVFKLGPEKRWWQGTALDPYLIWR